MMRSMFSSVAGLRSHQTKMDVIGNNIANVNTIGFKSSRTVFKESFSQTMSSASAPDANSGTGGVNPAQIGLGMGIASVDMITTNGTFQTTDSPTDLSIEGEGYFILGQGDTDSYMFSRAGNFGLDKQGNLVGPGGTNVYGWSKYDKVDGQYEFDAELSISKLNLFNDEYNKNKRVIAAQQTTSASLSGNLDSTNQTVDDALYGHPTNDHAAFTVADLDANGYPINYGDGSTISPQFVVPITVYDKLGNDYKMNINMWKKFAGDDGSAVGLSTTWYWCMGNSTDYTVPTGASGYLNFDTSGNIVNSATMPTDVSVTLTPAASTGTDDITIDVDFSSLTQYASESTAKPSEVDGYPPGNLVNFSIGGDGIITGVYDNGRQQPLGLIALATFSNPGGLGRVGGNMFVTTTNSGDFDKGIKPGSEGSGTLNPGTLEMSNVDLAKQFTEMIITQRGFQANGRVMTTSDEILQELSNLKR